MPIETIPSIEYVQEQITTLSQETQSKVIEVLRNRLMPRPCMSDEDPTASSIEQEESTSVCRCVSLLCNREALQEELKKKIQ